MRRLQAIAPAWGCSRYRSVTVLPAAGRCTRNPVSELLDRPAPPNSTTPLYEAEEVCLILESARVYEERHFDDFETAASCIYALLATFAYTGGRWSEVMALEIEDARRDLRDGLLTLVTSKTERYDSLPRTVQVPPALVEVLSAHIRRTGRLAGPLFATVNAAGEVNRLGDVRKTLARVAEQIGRGPDYIRGKPLRVSWTTHYSTVNGISIHDVRDAGGWANLKQLALVYGRARKRRVSMGDHLDFSVERWGNLVERELEALYNAPGGPPAPNGRRNEEGEAQWARERLQATQARATERTQVVRSFLRAVHGLTDYHASLRSGVDRAAIRRARMATDPSKVHTATVEKMRAALARIGPAARVRAS